MTVQEAKNILLLYRPHAVVNDDPEMARALALAREDAGLREWFDAHCAFQKAAHQRLCQISPPPALKERILSGRKIVHLHWWQQPAWLAAAAVILLLLVLSPLLLRPERLDRFDDYRKQMVRAALRQYRMDIVTNDLEQVRQFLNQRGAPADYRVPQTLARLAVTGGGKLKWRSNPVSMVCFDRGRGQMLFLFVLDQAAVKDPPSGRSPEMKQVSTLGTASWSEGGKTYILAGEETPEALGPYLPRI